MGRHVATSAAPARRIAQALLRVADFPDNVLAMQPFIYFRDVADAGPAAAAGSMAADAAGLVVQRGEYRVRPITHARTPLAHARPSPRAAEQDSQLMRVAQVLQHLAGRFASQQAATRPASVSRPDLRLLLRERREMVLRGCCILFSGVIPLGIPPETVPVWQRAVSFGAKCVTELTDEVTHVVAMRAGTRKVLEAMQRPGVRVVHLEWLQTCLTHWQRMDEGPFVLR